MFPDIQKSTKVSIMDVASEPAEEMIEPPYSSEISTFQTSAFSLSAHR